MEPTNDEIRKVLAEFMGWTNVDFTEDKFGLAATMGLYQGRKDYVPDYTHDLNAMHEVEERINEWGWLNEYQRALYRDVEGHPVPIESVYVYFPAWFEVWHMCHATANQRARAAYAVIKAQQAKDKASTD